MSKTVQNFIYLALTAITVVGGYIFLRLSYKISDSFPFTQEIILIVLGTVATILITALLLNKQTEVELHKEQQVRFLELKSDVYQDLLQHLENVMIDGKTDHRDAVRLQFLSHRLALVASPEILAEFENFLKAYQTAVADQAVSSSDSNAINRALAELTIRIRKDLIGEQDKASHIHTDEIAKIVRDNTEIAIGKMP